MLNPDNFPWIHFQIEDMYMYGDYHCLKHSNTQDILGFILHKQWWMDTLFQLLKLQF